jgi:hypothetical protein
MKKTGLKSGIVLITVFALCTCIDPYSPKLKGYDSLLVVDGLITDANTSYTVKLSRTFQDINGSREAVSGAIVTIMDDAGTSHNLGEAGYGLYKTDSLEFRGIVGRTYTLHITTREQDQYFSDPCLMQSVPDIDSIYFARDQELVNNGTESDEGIRIYLDSKPGDNNQYYRWSYEETWKFSILVPKQFNYINKNTFLPVHMQQYCWKNHSSDEVIIGSVYSGQAGSVWKEPITFIGSNKSDRLMIEYSILIKQYSISKNEYDFWDNLSKVNETGSDIFASQPFPVISNIHNINNPAERVLGYFQVSAVKEKRTFIPFSQIVPLHIPFYHNDNCQRIVAIPEPQMTFDDLYSIFCITSDYVFIAPLYATDTGTIIGLVFARPECANCSLTGTDTRPDFWVDII